MSIPEFDEIVESNDQTEARREHLEKLRELVGNVYPNKFDRSRISGTEDTITNILNFEPVAEMVNEIKEVVAGLNEGQRPPAEVKEALNSKLKQLGTVRVSGRLAVPPRVMGKAAFVHLSDGMNRLQIYARKEGFAVLRNTNSQDALDSQDSWTAFGLLDHGDFIGVEGYLFITNTGELSVHVEKLQFLAKAMLPMPAKMHGIADAEIRQRQRYADLIGSSLQVEHEGLTTREVFEMRAKVISSLRHFLEDHGYIEVETPMLTPKATGAAAKPFETHHNALDITLYARIAPELYLKRLVVGGFEKVYELNRNFRNEGISYKHNPEFTMLEFYCAYMDVEGMMNFCEELLRQSVQKAIGGLTVSYEGNDIDLRQFERLPMKGAIARYWTQKLGKFGSEEFDPAWLNDPRKVFHLTNYLCVLGVDKLRNNLEITPEMKEAAWIDADRLNVAPDRPLRETDEAAAGRSITFLFEELAERELIQPTFIVDFPKSISPLSKASPENPNIAERFELFINGMEVANGFSELNDPKEQYDRFIEQMGERDRGDEEAMILDEDYIRALSYGMPPAAGIGIGIDRLVMLLTNKHSIRDVILFPHLRPEKRENASQESAEGSENG